MTSAVCKPRGHWHVQGPPRGAVKGQKLICELAGLQGGLHQLGATLFGRGLVRRVLDRFNRGQYTGHRSPELLSRNGNEFILRIDRSGNAVQQPVQRPDKSLGFRGDFMPDRLVEVGRTTTALELLDAGNGIAPVPISAMHDAKSSR